MPLQQARSRSTFESLSEVVSPDLLSAIQLCAVPIALDEALAYSVLHDFAKLNGNALATWADIRSLPFVYPEGGGSWRYTPEARLHFTSQLERRTDGSASLHRYLVDFYEQQTATLPPDSPQSRAADWRASYHLAPIDPPSAAARAVALTDKAARARRASDLKAAVQLFEIQSRWLQPYEVERAYAEAHYAYTTRDYRTAEDRFDLVWRQANDDIMKAIAGHLLGVIWSRRSSEQSLVKAEAILRESLAIGIRSRQRYHQAHVLSTLGGVLMDRGGRTRIEEAEHLYRKSLALGANLGLESHQAIVSSSLAGALVRLGGPDRLHEAERLHRRSLLLGSTIGLRANEAIVLNGLAGVLVQLYGTERAAEAERLYRRSLQLQGALRMRKSQARTLGNLGTLLARLGRTAEAADLFRASLEVATELGDLRGRAMVLKRLADLAEKRGDIAGAYEYLQAVLSANEAMGSSYYASLTRRRLTNLRSKLNR